MQQPVLELLDDLEEDLLQRAFLYDDPDTYREAVDATLVAVKATLERAREHSVA
jgi:hypothetical protein